MTEDALEAQLALSTTFRSKDLSLLAEVVGAICNVDLEVAAAED